MLKIDIVAAILYQQPLFGHTYIYHKLDLFAQTLGLYYYLST
nr:MAG TPA: hypothetical protein [Caudoviricetes sp.]